MPGAPLSPDCKELALRLLDAGQVTANDIAATGVISLTTVKRLRRQWLEQHHSLGPTNPPSRQGRPRLISYHGIEFIRRLIAGQSDIYVDEIAAALEAVGFGRISSATVSRTLKRMGMSSVTPWLYASQQDPVQRLHWASVVGKYEADQLVFVDESSFDYRNTYRAKIRCPRGQRPTRQRSIYRGKRISLLPAIALGSGPFAIHIHEGAIDGEAFYDYLRDTLLPECNEFPAPRSVIVCDNCATHKSEAVQRLVELAGESFRRSTMV